MHYQQPMTTTLQYGSVCSGIEAVSLAWQPLGLQAAWFSEIEPFPCAVLAHHYPDVSFSPKHARSGNEYRPNFAAVPGGWGLAD